MAGRWQPGTVVTYFADMPEPYASWYDRAAQLWNAFGILRFERVYSAAEARIHAYFVHALPGNDLALSEMPVGQPPDVTLRSEFLANPPVPYTEQMFIEAAAHEIGHGFGLDHNENPRSIMTSVLNRCVGGPTDLDGFMFQALYPEVVPVAPAEGGEAAPVAEPSGPPSAAQGQIIIEVPTGKLGMAFMWLSPLAASQAGPPAPNTMAVAIQGEGVLLLRPLGFQKSAPAPAIAADPPPPDGTAAA